MSLRSLKLETHYQTGDQDIVRDFLTPCLEEAKKYDRAVGYFRSSAIAVQGPGIVRFAERSGRIRIICSPDLDSADVRAIIEGQQAIGEVCKSALIRELHGMFADPALIDYARILATLVSLQVMSVRIAVLDSGSGIFHEKLGIFTDTENDIVSFVGSSNETWSGWHPLGNLERNEVFCSWNDGERHRVESHVARFESLWNGESPRMHVIDLPKEVIDFISTKSLPSLQSLLPLIKRQSRHFTPRAHQTSVTTAWLNAGRRGIVEHATGSGKTITALMIAQDHLEKNNPVLVLVPSVILLNQWIAEIRKFFDTSPNILVVGGGKNGWRTGNRLKSFALMQESLGPRIIVATIQTASTSDFLDRLGGGEHLLVIADEVHQLGSPIHSKCLDIPSGARLGLSATPTRYADHAGTQKILDYFGAVLEPRFGLKEAIASKTLVGYEYFPHAVRLTESESDAWRKISTQIRKEYAIAHSSEVKAPLTERIKMLLIKRAAIAKRASAKIPLVKAILSDRFAVGQRWLVYCEDIPQLKQVVAEVKAITPYVTEYHSQMDGDRSETLRWIASNAGVLVAIACLDEGVDIPAIDHAIILASSQNPRQFIQRRGRVLRRYKGKSHAEIHDAIVVPIDIESEPEQTALLEAELRRAIEFAEHALNQSASLGIRQVAIDAGLDPSKTFQAGIEEDVDATQMGNAGTNSLSREE